MNDINCVTDGSVRVNKFRVNPRQQPTSPSSVGGDFKLMHECVREI